jgi:vancomycin resistance protein YoaR
MLSKYTFSMLNLLHHHFYQTVGFVRAYRTFTVLVAIFLIFLPIFWIQRTYHDRFYPNIFVDNIDLSGKNMDEAHQLLSAAHQHDDESKITLTVDEFEVSSSAAQLGVERSLDPALQDAFAVGHNNFWRDGLWRGFKLGSELKFTTTPTFDPQAVGQMISLLKQKIDNPGQDPSASLGFSGSVNSLKISIGKPGRRIEENKAQEQVLQQWHGADLNVAVPVASTSTVLSEQQVKEAQERAQNYVGKEITLKADRVVISVHDQELVKLLAFPEGYSPSQMDALLDKWTKQVDRPFQEPEFEYDGSSSTVKKFTPPRKGLQLNREETKKKLIETLDVFVNPEQKEKNIEITLPVQETQPTKKLGDLNSLGIKEVVGFGESQYAHSIPTRIHNVSLTAQNVNNTLVKPGEEFSFNKELGDISRATGYLPAYVIKDGRTVLGDGGGVCQVSTTLFRALLNGGLPITKRKPHSYRVSYYELNSKPGFDATVYTGEVDLRFVNDTDHALLIHSVADSSKLYMYVEIYGTSDGRTAEITDYKMWDFQSAPPAQYVDDQTIPRGSIKQIDFAASGIKASFKNVVKDASGNIIRTDEYKSNYIPWRAVFLRGV